MAQVILRKPWRSIKAMYLPFYRARERSKKRQPWLKSGFPGWQSIPCMGKWLFGKQQAALLPDPQGRRKIVLANGYCRNQPYHRRHSNCGRWGLYALPPTSTPISGLNRLVTLPVTQDTAIQRAGRAGRMGPGHCYRLWSRAKPGKATPLQAT